MSIKLSSAYERKFVEMNPDEFDGKNEEKERVLLIIYQSNRWLSIAEVQTKLDN